MKNTNDYSKRIHEIFVEFGYGNNTKKIEYAITTLINEIVLEAILEERNGLLQKILAELKELQKEIKESELKED